MKNLIYLFCLLMMACSVKEEKSPENKVSEKGAAIHKTDTSGVSEELKHLPAFRITFQVMYTSSYCGGAYPNEEIVAELEKKRCYQHSHMRFYNENEKKYYVGTTDNDGMGEITLPYGNYAVSVDTTTSEQMSHLYNTKCKLITERVWKRFVVNETGLVGAGAKPLWILLDFPCDPCDPSIKLRP